MIEAVVEASIKKKLFTDLEAILAKDAVLATNTSSLSVTAIAGACSAPERVIGLHFFNPAPLLPLVEVVPGIATGEDLPARCMELMKAWGKTPVLCKDAPGFIVNRVARPFYGEALRILEEGIVEYGYDRSRHEERRRSGWVHSNSWTSSVTTSTSR